MATTTTSVYTVLTCWSLTSCSTLLYEWVLELPPIDTMLKSMQLFRMSSTMPSYQGSGDESASKSM